MNRDLSNRFDALTARQIVSLSGEIEGQRLECKEVVDPTMRRGDSKKTFAVALSGFANAEGGIILWGVTAKKNDANVDCITAFPGVENAEVFVSRLNELTSEATAPGVSGVKHRAILGSSGEPAFAATLVPYSDAGPHMALLGENRYYQRIGQSMLPMEHFQIADMFGRRPQASLKLSVFHSPQDFRLLSVKLENVGRGIAVAPYLLFYEVRGPYVVSPFPATGKVTDFPLPRIQPLSRDGVDGFVGGMDNLIHPGLHFTFRALQLPNAWSGATPPTHCHASFRYGAAGVPEQHGRLIYDFSRNMFETLEGAELVS
jgi:hypothetical protein